MKNEVIIVDESTVKDKIYNIRGQQVMLDSDLAKIYGYTTVRLNEQVKRNIAKFKDEDFMFQLNIYEYKNLISQNATSSWGGTRKLPYAFTEQGIYMLMTVLKGEIATKQSIALVRIFKLLKDYVTTERGLTSYDSIINIALETKKNTEDIKEIKADLKNIHNLLEIGYHKEILILNGEQVESDLAYKKIYGLAKHNIYIIDNYISLKTLVLLKEVDKKVNVTIFSDNVKRGLHKIEFDDFIKEYNINLSLKKTNNRYHDRYIIIDYKEKAQKIFHCGASSKDSGNRITTITEINDTDIYSNIIDDLIDNEELILK